MKEYPINFADWEVLAALADRKSQARQVMEPQPLGKIALHPLGRWYPANFKDDPVIGQVSWRCPFGVPGDRLWVRETWAQPYRRTPTSPGCVYGADDDGIHLNPGSMDGRWRPSIHMPRWASRLTLEVADVRVERVQGISESDCEAEGIYKLSAFSSYYDTSESIVADLDPVHWRKHRKRCFAKLWDTRNAKRGHGWEVNPYVWVPTFRRLKDNG